ncbi:uncharacterized protein LOC116182891 [Photinus pyralis]|uniref:uncharacterized protein LOC116182891 n=1 Tax=Photinus pyralis TaxID=7054 RepID=UPI00126742D9|nr:uncharacterized protein LOC116182891 [Photinus pyralis]
MYSMLRSYLNVHKNVDISRYVKLQALLKRFSQGYEPKKSKILDLEQINRFIHEADDKHYLDTKVILIMGYSGACRREELTNMALGDIQYKNDIVVVSVPKTKTNVMRQFVITEKFWIDIIKKYSSIRPVNTCHQRFFVTYRSGRCITTSIGINTMGKTPRKIAEFLQLANPAQYTGHCFRRSSVSHLANSGSDLVTIKRHGGWKSSAVAEGYIET